MLQTRIYTFEAVDREVYRESCFVAIVLVDSDLVVVCRLFEVS